MERSILSFELNFVLADCRTIIDGITPLHKRLSALARSRYCGDRTRRYCCEDAAWQSEGTKAVFVLCCNPEPIDVIYRYAGGLDEGKRCQL